MNRRELDMMPLLATNMSAHTLSIFFTLFSLAIRTKNHLLYCRFFGYWWLYSLCSSVGRCCPHFLNKMIFFCTTHLLGAFSKRCVQRKTSSVNLVTDDGCHDDRKCILHFCIWLTRGANSKQADVPGSRNSHPWDMMLLLYLDLILKVTSSNV